MKSLLKFWQHDIINKLIILVGLAVVLGFVVLAFLFFQASQTTILADVFFPADPNAIPTAAPIQPTDTPVPTPTTMFFPSATPDGFVARIATSAPTQELPTVAPPPTAVVPGMAFTASPAGTGASGTAIPAGLPACIPSHTAATGSIVEIIDGNTARVYLDSDKRVHTLRYIGIAVPAAGEYPETWGNAAKDANTKLVYGRKVTLITDVSDADARGRLLRYVVYNGALVNLEMIRQGFATALDVSPDSSCAAQFAAAEQAARSAKAGRWAAVPTP